MSAGLLWPVVRRKSETLAVFEIVPYHGCGALNRVHGTPFSRVFEFSLVHYIGHYIVDLK